MDGDFTNVTNATMINGSSVGIFTTVGSMTNWINENAVCLGLLLTLTSIIVGVVFNMQTVRWRVRQEAQSLEIMRQEIINELQANRHNDGC